ncbi:MAG: aminomethyl-transferring glycine dehydrogenase subunit GcvPB [Planctomycetaceae bacterium]|nr:aminomethyl-transferring glycine dehydrogenase subunit GcvPB [Planctomycetota bacterium]NUN51361.1 aminomethyl-transferring glycine dehydrogenase subunit GcvPB [Planctomycetaceae bacterium]
MHRDDDPLLYETSRPGLRAAPLPKPEVPVPADAIPAHLRRKAPPLLPEVTEGELARHFVKNSRKNVCVETGFYPLGSCTMKYNPKRHEDFVMSPALFRVHPYQPEEGVQPVLRMLWEMSDFLEELTGFHGVSVHPSAGSHGELTCLMMIRAYHSEHHPERDEILIPDSAHGTNPASVTMCGMKPVNVPSRPDGLLDIQAMKALIGPRTAGAMVTNPNTLGLFERQIHDLADALHAVDAFLFMDGANFNAIVGKARPADFGADCMHINLHKTFTIPHGGGGPGSGPIGYVEKLAPYAPTPVVVKEKGKFRIDWNRPKSIGPVRTFLSSTGATLRSYAYIRTLGAEGVRRIAEGAVLNANYLRVKLRDVLKFPYDRTCMHEFVASGTDLKERTGVKTLDVAKRLLDHGFHPPTVYFPLIVPECLMIEPTETESKATLDAFADALHRIVKEAETDPAVVTTAPHTMPVRRLDEVKAARDLRVRWRPEPAPAG